jgi:hypothetical protein
MPTISLTNTVLAQLTGFDLSSQKSAVESTIEFIQSAGSVHTLALLGVVLLEIYWLLSPLTIQLGFRAKRAIFAEGKTVRNLFDKPELERWVDFPKTNIYHQENQVFEALGVPKPKEFPLDYVMAFLPFYAFGATVFISVQAVNTLTSGGTLALWDIIGMICLWVTLISSFVNGRRNLLARINQGNI